MIVHPGLADDVYVQEISPTAAELALIERIGAKAFDPSEHPRDDHGRWAKKPGSRIAAAFEKVTGSLGRWRAPREIKPARFADVEDDLFRRYNSLHLEADQWHAFSHYLGGLPPDINVALREGKLNDDQRKQRDGLDALLAKQPLPYDMTLRRSTHFEQEFPDAKPGDVFTEPGYLSTSPSGVGGARFGPDHLILHTPKGTPAYYYGGLGEEDEMLLGRGMAVRIDKVSDAIDGRRIDATVLPPDVKPTKASFDAQDWMREQRQLRLKVSHPKLPKRRSRQRDSHFDFFKAARKQFEKDRKVEWPTWHESYQGDRTPTSLAAFDVANTWPLPEIEAAATFELPEQYDDIQLAARDPQSLVDHLKQKYTGTTAVSHMNTTEGDRLNIKDSNVEDVAAEISRQMLWLDQAIEDHGEEPPIGKHLWRVSGIDHLDPAQLEKLHNGETIYVTEPGFFSTTTNQGFADNIGDETARGDEPAMLDVHNPSGVKALNIDNVVDAVWPENERKSEGDTDASEWIFPRNTRFAIKMTDRTHEPDYPYNLPSALPVLDVTVLPPA